MSKKKVLIILSVATSLALILSLITILKNKSSNKKSVDIWHQVVIDSNSVGDYASNSVGDSNTSSMLSAVVKLNSTLDDSQFKTSKLSYWLVGGSRKNEMTNSIQKIKDYNSKLKTVLDQANVNSSDLSSSDINDLKSASDDMKSTVENMVSQVKFSEDLSDNYYQSYEYPQNVSDKLSEAKTEEEKQQQQDQQAKDDEAAALKSAQGAVDGFMGAYVRKDFPGMKSNMTSGYQGEFKFSEIEAGWDNSHPKSYRIVSTVADGSNWVVSVNTIYYSAYPDQNGNNVETENTANEKYRVVKSDSGAYLVDGQIFNY